MSPRPDAIRGASIVGTGMSVPDRVLTNFQAGLSPADLDLVIPHQASQRIIEVARALLEVPEVKVVVNIDRYDNTSAASIPITLGECVWAGRLKPGSTLGLVAFGRGATWGASVARWTMAAQNGVPATAAMGAAAQAAA